jgi:hypothetical protein
MSGGSEDRGWDGLGDMWAGTIDDEGHPLDGVYEADLAPHESPEGPADASAQEAIAARYRLPEEFWGARELFKRIRQAAWASGSHPDAVLGCVLARAAGAVGHEVLFDSGRGGPGTLSLFVCLLAPSGVGKTDAYNAATTLVRLPDHLTDYWGEPDPDVFRDGLALSTGEGIAETFMGVVERETGRMVTKGRGRNAQPEPEMERVRTVVRHRACFFMDEGELLTTLIHGRQGSTLGPTLRTAWVGQALSQANASEEKFRYVPKRSYSMGVIIGYQPDVAVALLADVGPGTPQRFLWFGAQDTEMPEDPCEWPEPVTLPPNGAPTGIIEFPAEIKRWLRAQHRGKHRGEIVVDPMDSHEPLMRCKLTALLCYLDGRMMVNRDDWILAGMIWATSRSIRDRLIGYRDQEAAARKSREREDKLNSAAAEEAVRLRVSSDIERVARRIARKVSEQEAPVRRAAMRRDFGRDKTNFNAALAHAEALGWVSTSDDESVLLPGAERPM